MAAVGPSGCGSSRANGLCGRSRRGCHDGNRSIRTANGGSRTANGGSHGQLGCHDGIRSIRRATSCGSGGRGRSGSGGHSCRRQPTTTTSRRSGVPRPAAAEWGPRAAAAEKGRTPRGGRAASRRNDGPVIAIPIGCGKRSGAPKAESARSILRLYARCTQIYGIRCRLCKTP